MSYCYGAWTTCEQSDLQKVYDKNKKIGGTCGWIKKIGHKSRLYYLLKKYDVMKPRKSITYIDKRGRMIRHGTQGECR